MTNKILATAISALVLAGSVSVVSADAQSRPGGRAPATRVAPPSTPAVTPAPAPAPAPTIAPTVAPAPTTTTAPLAIPAPTVVAQNAVVFGCSSQTVIGYARLTACRTPLRPGSRQSNGPVVIEPVHPPFSAP